MPRSSVRYSASLLTQTTLLLNLSRPDLVALKESVRCAWEKKTKSVPYDECDHCRVRYALQLLAPDPHWSFTDHLGGASLLSWSRRNGKLKGAQPGGGGGCDAPGGGKPSLIYLRKSVTHLCLALTVHRPGHDHSPNRTWPRYPDRFEEHPALATAGEDKHSCAGYCCEHGVSCRRRELVFDAVDDTRIKHGGWALGVMILYVCS